MKLERTFRIRKTFASSTFLWLRPDKSREAGCSYWSGDHAKLVSADPTFIDYRQHHFSADNYGLWPKLENVQTLIPQSRKMDGMPEVTFKSIISPLMPAFSRNNIKIMMDEKYVFSRTILHLTWPFCGRWFEKDDNGISLNQRIILLIRRRKDINNLKFYNFINNELGQLLAADSRVLELRTQCFMKWDPKMWLSEGVLHDYPENHQFHASLVIGGESIEAITKVMILINSIISKKLSLYCAAIHAYDVERTYTYIKNGKLI